MDNALLIESLQKEFSLSVPEKISITEIKEMLSSHINHLITNNFNLLVSLLYRIDVNETKLKTLLKDNPGEDAGRIIAELIIERQLQKIKTRQQFNQGKTTTSEEEAW
jgi:hypothetical protein